MKKSNNHHVTASPRYPEVLPWFARRANISDVRAKALWDQTCRDLNAPDADPSLQAKARMAQFIERIGQEAGLPITADYNDLPNGPGWLYRHYGRLTDMTLVAAGAFTKCWQQAMTPGCPAR